MITSIPTSALKLGIGFQEYEELARNIQRISLIHKTKRQKILDRANKELPPELNSYCSLLIKEMAYDRKIYEIAGLDYAKGPPKGEGLITTALADYLLREKPFLKSSQPTHDLTQD